MASYFEYLRYMFLRVLEHIGTFFYKAIVSPWTDLPKNFGIYNDLMGSHYKTFGPVGWIFWVIFLLLFIGLIAGGDNAFVKAVEGAEDSRELAVEDLKNISLNEKDMVIGIAASGRTPYVIGGLDYAREVGASTGCLCCNFNTEIADHCDLPIELSAGPEVVTGSTRLKSGTCQKIVLNMISTVTMVKVGKVFGNLMVDVKATNEKLVERCRRVVMEATGCNHVKADAVLKETENNCKLAIVMILLNIPLNEAKEKLAQADDNIRIALN